ncbi:dGTPase [Klebsiella michiganensis]|uniref:dGTPase n=1 Tax=Klebsiella michiganensis TaxID=1134687 RepID=UPI0015E4BAC0|nr:dGTPase [Klebsiella michiganensis]MBA8304377.1 dGTPase [Klebsiella michiganensis]MDH1343181.1 dGTPase [Klebsiella michiganensis]QLP34032.1 dGTPase [Klebsiella michiganensis]WFX47677.1 dGTPase [Klebsiella michiganensis]WFX53341.1 dGTPase [Klebsiella michiganensis]
MENLISVARHRSSSAKHSTVLASTQSDRARLIYSAAFRRLQQKAQVFSLESNSAVRSRLTHSIEVSHIGRYIVAAIIEKLAKNTTFDSEQKKYWLINSLAISNIVETACLMHDIGNPPFGHFGEAAIVTWSKSEEIKKALKDSLCDDFSLKIQESLLADFRNFDGNPQGLRILTRLQGDDGLYGLNLTYTQLAAFLKYTFSPDEMDKGKPFSKKIGYFSSEKEIMHKAWKTLGMKNNSRHPLGFLMEASDDISYCISDIEDGIEKGIITASHFREFTSARLRTLKEQHPSHIDICEDLLSSLNRDNPSPIGNFLSFKTNLSNFLVYKVADIFITDYEEFRTQKRDKEIISKGTFEYDILDILKDYTSNYLFTSSDAECMELSGFSIIKGILEEYLKLLSLPKDKFSFLVLKDNKKIKENDLHIQRRLFNRLPGKHLKAYKTSVTNIPYTESAEFDEKLKIHLNTISRDKEWGLRIHLIVDFVSGMTDQFSMEMYQLLKGIKVK